MPKLLYADQAPEAMVFDGTMTYISDAWRKEEKTNVRINKELSSRLMPPSLLVTTHLCHFSMIVQLLWSKRQEKLMYNISIGFYRNSFNERLIEIR